jgi:hypothetical protein
MYSILWDCGLSVSDFGINVPDWIEQDISCYDVAAIVQGGCASGAYMPAVTYSKALEIMSEHGNDVLEYIENSLGGLPSIPVGESWSGIAVFFLSYAVELWVNSVEFELEAAIKESQGGE